MGALTVADLVPGDAEPRIKDLVLAERLGFEHPRRIRGLIESHRDELEFHGILHQVGAKITAGRGRAQRFYLLNEMQAALVCMWARTPNAAAVRAEMVRVFVAYRHGLLVPADSLPQSGENIRHAGGKSLPVNLSEKQSAEANARLAILKRVEQLADGGMRRTQAIVQAAREAGVARSTVWNWLALVDNPEGRPLLAAIAPRWRGGGRKADIPDDIWVIFMGAQLMTPIAARSFRIAKAAADSGGIEIPCRKTFERRFRQVAADALRSSLQIEGPAL